MAEAGTGMIIRAGTGTAASSPSAARQSTAQTINCCLTAESEREKERETQSQPYDKKELCTLLKSFNKL